jgi:hypothetical protein
MTRTTRDTSRRDDDRTEPPAPTGVDTVVARSPAGPETLLYDLERPDAWIRSTVAAALVDCR